MAVSLMKRPPLWTLIITVNDNLQQMAYETYMHIFYGRKTNGKLGDIIIENEKSTVQVGEVKESTGDYPFFTSGDAILRWKSAIVSGRNCFLNTGGNAGVKFYVGDAAYSTDTCDFSRKIWKYHFFFVPLQPNK